MVWICDSKTKKYKYAGQKMATWRKIGQEKCPKANKLYNFVKKYQSVLVLVVRTVVCSYLSQTEGTFDYSPPQLVRHKTACQVKISVLNTILLLFINQMNSYVTCTIG